MPLSKKRDAERKRMERAKCGQEVSNLTQRAYALRRKNKIKGQIYFILDEWSQAVKIGIADNPFARLIDLQVGNPHKLRLLKVIEAGSASEELEFHQRFAKERLAGEWFSFTGELLDFVQPNKGTLQSKIRGLEKETSHILSPPVQPNSFLLAHMKVYPQGFHPDGSYRKDYDPKLDLYINPLVHACVIPKQPLPNCPDGRYHECNDRHY